MYRTCFLALLLAAPIAHADPLSEADREALLEKLDTVTESAEKTAATRQGTATTAYRAAMSSDSAALELFLKAIEKEEFTDKKRSPQDFREWKRNQGDRLDGEALGRCMRHQLRWLVLLIDASNNAKPEELAPRVSEAMESIYGSLDQYTLYRNGAGALHVATEAARGREERNPREIPVAESVVAKAYGYGGVKSDKIPATPMELGEVFDKVIFPPLRAKKSFESLREQWQRRIRYEALTRQYNGNPDKSKATERSPEYEKFMTETQPELVWAMEIDLYKAGDQKRAAIAMLEHLNEHVSHPKARDWANSFRQLIGPAKASGPETAEKTGE